MKANNVLAIDTSTEQCSVALRCGDRWATRAAITPREHSQRVLGFVEDVLAELNVSLSDIDQLVVGNGPGSFTGVRIGVSVAQGLAFSQHLPVVTVNTLQALAQQAIRVHQSTTIVSAIDARMEEIYVALFTAENGFAVQQIPAQMAPLAPLMEQSWWPIQGSVAGAGTGWQAYLSQLDPSQQVQVLNDVSLPLAEDMIRLADQGMPSVLAEAVEPLYVRNEVAWKKLPGR